MNNLSKPLTREEFDECMSKLGLPPFFDNEYCYEIYLLANEGIKILNQENSNIVKREVNQQAIALYCAGEIIYVIEGNPNTYDELKNDESKNQIAGVVADKYLSF